MIRRALVVAFAFVIGSAASAAAAPFTNGSFELASVNPGAYATLGVGSQAITGWEVFGSNIDYIGTFWQPSDGSRSLDLNGNNGPGGIRQTFDTVVGHDYLVEFDFAAHEEVDGQRFSMQVDVGTLSNFGFSFTAPFDATRDNMRWRHRVVLFRALSDLSTLSIWSTTDNQRFGPALDNVTVTDLDDDEPTPVPEPATLSLLGIGLVGVALRRRARTPAPTPAAPSSMLT
jgi:choice-of-anchor C domain-containing protein